MKINNEIICYYDPTTKTLEELPKDAKVHILPNNEVHIYFLVKKKVRKKVKKKVHGKTKKVTITETHSLSKQICLTDNQALTKDGRPFIGPINAILEVNGTIRFITLFIPLIQGEQDHFLKHAHELDKIGILCHTKDIPIPPEADLSEKEGKFALSKTPGFITIQTFAIYYGKSIFADVSLLKQVDLSHPQPEIGLTEKKIARYKTQIAFFMENKADIFKNLEKIIETTFNTGKGEHDYNVMFFRTKKATIDFNNNVFYGSKAEAKRKTAI